MFISTKKAIIVIISAALIAPLQGCDQVKKFVDYLSPNNNATQTAQETDKPKPAPAKVAPAKTQQPETPQQVKKPGQMQETEMALNILAQVGAWSLSIDEFNERLQAVKKTVPEFDLNNIEQKRYILSELIQQQLLVQEALARGLDKTEEVVSAMQDLRNTLLVQVLGARLTEGLEVTDEEARTFYDENPDFFKTLNEWKVREIIVDSEAKAKELLVMLNQGSSFEEVAKTQSISSTASSGGDLGYLTIPTGEPTLDQNVFPFEKMAQTATALDAGSISGAFKGPEGFYIVKVEDVRGGEEQPFEEIEEDLKQYLLGTKQQQVLVTTLQKAQEQHPININEKLLEE